MMDTFLKRRIANSVGTASLCLVLLTYLQWQRHRLGHVGFTSGYLLLGTVIFLAAYNWRKKLSILPLGTSAFWLQLHIYVGFSSIVLFLAHIGLRWPNGQFESILAGVFSVVAASGLYGLYLSRTVPRKISQLAGEVIYERVPVLRRQLAQAATRLAFTSVHATHSPTIAEFYAVKLSSFFERPRGAWYAVFPSSHRRRRLMAELSHLDRFFSEPEKKVSERFFTLIRKKDDLDYQYAMQRKLKVWLFVHVGLTYTLLVLAAFHTVLAHAFHGGMR